jgi:hypothetical protein
LVPVTAQPYGIRVPQLRRERLTDDSHGVARLDALLPKQERENVSEQNLASHRGREDGLHQVYSVLRSEGGIAMECELPERLTGL